ncbi:MAG: NAD(P)H-hydrate dehydratase [Clostridia bacterium]|nr:NAD(P)H-hydrate dehydratase [Clostridia bacterium]
MLLADSIKARLIDNLSINKYGVPSVLLMENAGMRVADVALETGAERFAVVVGKGNNGGDGSVAARHILCNGKYVDLILLADEEKLCGDAKLMFETAKGAGVNIINGFTDDARECILKADVIIDGILGIGCTGEPDEYYSNVIDYINSLDKYVIAIDVPSGVNATNGNVWGAAVRCKKTVTFSVGRTGLCLYPAKEYAGENVVKQISFTQDAIKDADIKTREVEYLNNNCISEDCHKGSVGKVLVAAGSVGMTGAAYIASTSALKSGSGVVTLCIPESLNNIMEQKLTEVMTVPVDEADGFMTFDASVKFVDFTDKYDVVVMGCGMGNNENTKKFVNNVIKNAKCPMVIDADGLNSMDKSVLKAVEKNIVITPHLGEMSRLTGYDVEYIKNNICDVALEFAKEYSVAVVLKCATTVVAFPDGEVYINTKGNSGMATAGSGDALAGIIGSFIAQGGDFKTAVVNGVYIHSAAGDKAAEKFGKKFMSATDITDCLKYVLN